MIKARLYITAGLLLAFGTAKTYAAGIENPVKWQVETQRQAGDTLELRFRAQVDTLWKVYAARIPGEASHLQIEITLNSDNAALLGISELTPSKESYDSIFEMPVRYFTKEFDLTATIVLQGGDISSIAGTVEYKSCNMKSFTCTAPTYDFEVEVEATGAASASNMNAGDSGSGSLWGFFALALLMGFAGVLTPCVFPMIPMTISFFMRQSSKRTARLQLLVFSLSVAMIYTAIGAAAALTKSTGFVTALSAHWLPNLVFFALFVVFAISFLGAFELSLPQRWVNRIDVNAEKGGYAGAFFVALTLCVVSFSCTGPFAGALLVAAAQGAVIKPLVGMFGFGFALALPFTLLGMFPAAMNKLPKSGEWMNRLKVAFAFILIMCSMKFLSIADTDCGWNLISRELFLSVWTVCLVLWGMYIMGRIPLPHHNENKTLSPLRLLLALVVFSAAAYLFAGLMGNKVTTLLEGILPEKTYSQQRTAASTESAGGDNLCGSVRFADNASLTSPVPAYYDLQEAIACARQQNKPLLLYFKGHSCANCKRMQAAVFTDPQVRQALRSDYVVATLYTDDKTELPQAEWYVSDFDGKIKKTLGQQNLDYQVTHYNVNSMPFFVIEGSDRTMTTGYTADAAEFLTFLAAGSGK